MAARGVNRVTLVGFLGQDPEVRYMPDGGAVANITLATSDTWRDKQTGEMKEQTEWHRIVLFRKLAEVAGEYLRKGAQVYIEGQLRTRSWQDDSGMTRYVTEIVVGQNGTMQMLGRAQNASHSDNRPFSGQAPVPDAPAQAAPAEAKGGKGKKPKAAAKAQPQPQSQPPQGEWPPMDDDIPF